MSDFSRYTNYKSDAGVSGVVFGAQSTILEVELNELQEISKNMLRDFIKNVAKDGITDRSKMVYADGTFKVEEGCAFAVDGILINCSGLSLEATNGDNIYLQVWEETVDYTAEFHKDGNEQAETVDNWAKDDRSDVETSRRKVVRYTVAKDTAEDKHNLLLAYIGEDGKLNKVVNEVNLQNLAAGVDDIKALIGITDDDVYGVEADWANYKFTRLGKSMNKVGGEDHDGIGPWNRRRCNVANDGTVTAYYGEDGYTETGKLEKEVKGKSVGTRVQVMVEQPKFYYRMLPLELEPISGGIGFKVRKARYYISMEQSAGFKLFPAFERNGVVKDFIYDSAFKGCIYDQSADAYITNDTVTADWNNDKLASIANAKPASGITNELTRANCRKLAANNGAGWQQSDFLVDTMTAWLFLIEYATMNAQAILGNGVADFTDDTKTNMAINTGGTSKLGNKSGMADGDNGKVSVTYRGKEDPFGNIWSFSDGLNIEANNKNLAYYADHGFADDTSASPYKPCGFTLAPASGYISAFGWSESCDFAFLPAEATGDSTKPVGDYTWVNPSATGWLIALLGGGWHDGLFCGLCSWHLNNTSSSRYRNVGGRLVYIPS